MQSKHPSPQPYTIQNHKQKQPSPQPYPIQNHKQKQLSQQTPCSIKKTYTQVSVVPNEKDGPKMTTAQCNLRRQWSSLQCVRDGERTKDHENSARFVTNKIK
jgi:hypothetical protein